MTPTDPSPPSAPEAGELDLPAMVMAHGWVALSVPHDGGEAYIYSDEFATRMIRDKMLALEAKLAETEKQLAEAGAWIAEFVQPDDEEDNAQFRKTWRAAKKRHALRSAATSGKEPSITRPLEESGKP